MYTSDEIFNIHRSVWEPVLGSISDKEAEFIQIGIIQNKPKNFLEIGTASGLSAAFIALFMEQNGGEKLLTLDFDSTFWGDRSKQTGFLVDKVLNEKLDQRTVNVEYVREKTSAHIAKEFDQSRFDMAFIDAQHQHPWPTLDMIAILPFMQSNAFIYHHDLALYKDPYHLHCVGPKHLFDQIPSSMKMITHETRRNIFYVKAPENHRDYEQYLIDSLYHRWSLMEKIEEDILNEFMSLCDDFWSDDLKEALRITSDRFNFAIL